MKKWLQIVVILALVLTVAVNTRQPAQAGTIPGISIVSVEKDVKVTIETANFPANQTFTVRMGKYGTYGTNGTEVGKIESGAGGKLTASFNIPAALKGEAKIAIRAESAQGYYAYDWFTNNTAAPTATAVYSGYSGYPTSTILGVAKDTSVKIKFINLPPNQTFVVRINKYGTYGKGGPEVGKIETGKGGTQEATFNIPAEFKGLTRLAIRGDSTSGYYAYDWFDNTNSGTVATGTPAPTATPGGPTATPTKTATPAPTQSGYTGYPTTSIVSVEKDVKVKIKVVNLPPNQTFIVRMGLYGTYGVNGTEVGKIETGVGGTQEASFDIPAGLKGQDAIAIRIESAQGYFAYDWFYNVTKP